MNTKSIHFRLTLWYSTAFFISTAIVFVVFYFIAKQTLLYHTDQAITAHAQTLMNIVSDTQPSMVTGIFNQGIISQQFAEMPGMLVVITDPSGKITASSQIGAESNPVIQDLIVKSTNIIKPTFVERHIGTSTLRIGVYPIVKDGNNNGLVFMGDPVEAIYRSLNTLLFTLAIVYALFSIPTVLGSYFLARSAMQPINKISAELKNITSHNLNQQVEVPKTADEIAELATSFNGLLGRLHEAFKRERQFIGDVAHELKTPIATLKSGIEVTLSKNRTKEEYKKAVNETLIDADRLSSTVRNILDLAWIEADNASIGNNKFSLSDALTDIQEIAVKLASQKRITVNGHTDSGVMTAGAEDKISRAILNIVDNAVKYTPNGGVVTLILRQVKDRAVIEVRDSGPGIPENEQEHIFERFYRGSKATKLSGSGLGLAITKGIIKSHNGDIKITSKAGKGTSVTITLPLA